MNARLLSVTPLLVCVIGLLPIFGKPNFTSNIARPLRYRPDDTAFVIHNGREVFNRPLYGPNSPFRVDAGDRPEFAFYLPGRGGNLRLGLKVGAKTKWLVDADEIEARYVNGAMDYLIHDALIGSQTLRIGIVTTVGDGVVIRVKRSGLTTMPQVELIGAYGGVTGKRASRDGDIGTEKVPMREFFQLAPGRCKGNRIELLGDTSIIGQNSVKVMQVWPQGTSLFAANATGWNSPQGLIDSINRKVDLPLVVARVPLLTDRPLFIGVQRGSDASVPSLQLTPDKLAALYSSSRDRVRAVAQRVIVATPDPFVNAAMSALCVAGDATWDAKQTAFMHGAVAWRVPLLGWRGSYMGDALGWHERTAEHLSRWFDSCTATPGVIMEGEAAPAAATPASEHAHGDPGANLARNEPLLHSEGDLTRSHYDMNMVAVDSFFRHLRWTGDLAYARKFWPVIDRHFAWEQRLFRRTYGPEKLPLYEAYAAIWASDDLEYDGGGATHSSAYLYWQYTQAAAVAKALGVDPAPYAREAALIRRAMREYLWLPERGWYAEWKDLLGEQSAHPDPGLWSFYHAVDSDAMTPLEAWQMTRFVDTHIAHIPLKGKGVPDEGAFTLPTTRWMPYTWSTNNVVMAEAVHTALGYWQAGRNDVAYSLLKGALLDSMYVGLCPGNVGMCTGFDMARGETQRDFADGCGILSRALVEGLFGYQPNAIAGELLIRPGFPDTWEHATLNHPDGVLAFRRQGVNDVYEIEQRRETPLALRLRVNARSDRVADVRLNGETVRWRAVEGAVGRPAIEVTAPAAARNEITITWGGEQIERLADQGVVAIGANWHQQTRLATVAGITDPQQTLSDAIGRGHELSATFKNNLGDHVVFALLRQGDFAWLAPVTFETRAAFEIVPSEVQPAGSLVFRLRNNTSEPIDGDLMLAIDGVSASAHVRADAHAESPTLRAGQSLLPGSHRVRATCPNGATAEAVIENWAGAVPEGTKWESVDLAPLFNDRVTQIFKNEYVSPRSPYCSLAIPKQGVGSWCRFNFTATIQDDGLRAKAAAGGGVFHLPNGIPFRTPPSSDAKNILFTSQWDNYPREVKVPLTGNASHVYLLMAGSTNWMQSRFQNGEVLVRYTDGTNERLALENPTNWWPIDQDYLIDDYAFARPEPIPPRVNLATGEVRFLRVSEFKGKGKAVPGGAANVLDLPLDRAKTLESLTLRTSANEVVIGLMAATLVR